MYFEKITARAKRVDVINELVAGSVLKMGEDEDGGLNYQYVVRVYILKWKLGNMNMNMNMTALN